MQIMTTGRLSTSLSTRRSTAAPAPPTAAPAAKPATQPTAAPAADAEVDTIPFVHADGLDAVTLDPHSAPDVAYSHNLQRASAEGLLEYVVKPDGSIDIGPLLAKSWAVEELRTFTFQLNEGIKFHDGTPFNAEAVKFNFERIREYRVQLDPERPPLLRRLLPQAHAPTNLVVVAHQRLVDR